jgi:hypothetical protein
MALTRPRYSQIPDSDYKNSCRIVTTTDVTLTSGAPLTYDGVTLVQYDRVLVAGQTDKTQNGIYSVSTLGSGSNGTWVRSKDANANDRLTAGMNTFVEEGTYTGQFWHLLTPGPIVLGVTELIFGQISGNAAGISSQVQYNSAGSVAGAANLRYDSATGNVLIGGGTISTSNVTGALTVNGGIGVTGEIWAQGNIYSVGSRVLTTYDLETVTFLANYISKDPANVYVPVVGTGTIYGTHNFGNLEAISTFGDYNTTAQSGYYSVNDASGAPGFIVYAGFTGISDFNRAVYNINYTQNSGHTITIDLYNYDTDAWDALAQYSGSGSWQTFALSVIDANPYIDATGNVTTRIYHVSSGNTAHRTWIDYIALEKSITGGSGPRGATGPTGPSGTYSGGYISGAIITGGNIITSGNIVSNSGNISLSTTTGALIITGDGGAGIGGNVNVGGNVTASAFYTLNGLFWSANGLAFSSGLEVSEINAANTLSNISSQVTSIRFDKDTGFSVTELDPGNVKISLGSSFKTWHVPGQADLVAAAEDEVTFFGNGIDITTNPTYPKAITFISNNSILEANIGAFYNYANANIGTLYLGNVSTQANIGAYQNWANIQFSDTTLEIDDLYLYIDANAAAQSIALNTINANLGSYQLYANANVGSIYNNLNTLDANIGSYQLFANANLATQTTNYNTLNANIGAFYNYANTIIGPSNTGNLVVNATTESVSSVTGALVVKGGAGIAGNLYVAGNIYASNLTSISVTTLTVTDPMLYLAASNPFPYNYDIGFYSHYVGGTPSQYQHTGLARDYNNGVWGFFSNIHTEPGAVIDWSNVDIIYDTVRAGDLIVSNTTQSTSTTSGALRVAGGAGIAGELYIANTGDVSANIGRLHNANIAINANLGAYQIYANANVGSIYNNLNTLDANIGSYQLYANANIGTLYLGNISTNANLGAFQSYSNANVGSIYNNLTTLNANVGAYQLYANANVGSIYNNLTTLDANIGSYQTFANANLATQTTNYNTLNANIGAFYTYANTIIGPENTGNLVVNATTDSTSQVTGALVVKGGAGIAGNIYSGGNIVVTSNISANKFYTTDGIYWTGNGAAYAAGGGGSGSFTYTASATTPVGPVVGDQWFDTVDGILYEYIDDGDSNQWVDIQSPTLSSNNVVTSISGNISTDGNITASGNISGSSIVITSGIFWSNGTAFASSTYSNVNVEAYIGANIGSYQTYANTTFTSYSNTNAAAYLTTTLVPFANSVSLTAMTNSQLYYVTFGNVTAGNTILHSGGSLTWNPSTQALVAAGSVQTSSITAAAGGVNVFNTTATTINMGGAASNVLIGTTSGTATNTIFGGTGITGGQATGNIYAGNIQATTFRFANGVNILSTVSGGSTYSNTNVAAYLTQGANIGSGTTTGNLVAGATTTSTSTTTGALVVQGGAGIAGNVYVGNEFVVTGGGKITSTGIAYLLEKVTVSASAPSTTVDVDMATQSVLYWTGNATANVTANIRGTATQPLNSLLAIGQSVTAVLFFPNGPSNYLVNTVKIDNTTVALAYQGNAAPLLGNSNSIDIYSFTILKTADATYKIFASQTQFMHPG